MGNPKYFILSLAGTSWLCAFLLFGVSTSINIGEMRWIAILGGIAAIPIGALFFWLYKKLK